MFSGVTERERGIKWVNRCTDKFELFSLKYLRSFKSVSLRLLESNFDFWKGQSGDGSDEKAARFMLV